MFRSLRLLRKNPGFTLLAGFTLALGIGLNTAMFSVIHTVLLAPLPYPNPEQIVSINTEFVSKHRSVPRVTGGDLVDLQKETDIFQAVGIYGGGQVGAQLKDRAEFIYVSFSDAAFFRVLDVAPVAGRWFRSEDQSGAMVTESFAKRNFGSPAAALDQTVKVENTAYRITGVMPGIVNFPAKTELWVQLNEHPSNTNRSAFNYRAIARLKAQPATANARLQALARQIATTDADGRDHNFVVVPLQDQLTLAVRGTLWILMAAVGLILLIACSNVANLMVARSTGRTREISVRVALGATKSQLVRQLLGESLALALPAAGMGVVLAYWSLDLLFRLAPAGMPRLAQVGVEPVTLAFAVVTSVLAAAAAGLAPAFQLAGRTELPGLKMRSSHAGNLRGILVVGEVALSVVLLVGSALLLRTYLNLNSVELGFDKNDVLVAYAHMPAKGLKEVVAVSKTISSLLPQLAAIPGVTNASAAMGMPAGQYGSDGRYELEGREVPKGQEGPQALFRLASPNYFATLGIPILGGRDFAPQDSYNSPFVAIISNSLARQSFPNENPIGRRIRCGLDSDNWMTVVGVVADINSQSPAKAMQPELYMPLEQHPFFANEVQLALRLKPGVQMQPVMTEVRERIVARNRSTAIRFTTLDQMLDGAIHTERFRAFLITTFPGLALLLAIAGVYAMMSFWTLQRTPEIGLRVALGATPGGLVLHVLRQAAMLGGAGLAIGIPAALVSGRVLEGMLFGLKPMDPGTYVAVAAMLLTVVLAASAVPAYRASRVDPLSSLRQD